MIRSFLISLSILGLVSTGLAVDYEKEIKPILTKHCYQCHGADKAKSSLRVDSIAAMKEGGDGGAAIVPGNAKKSRIFLAISGGNKEVSKMPPKGDMTAAEIEQIKTWIDAGSPGMDGASSGPKKVSSSHWSFQPIVRHSLPEVKNEAWIRNPIDHFILARLEKEKLTPAAEADRVTLLRRVYLDLLGLPPTPAVVEKFLKDSRPDAYERMVDEALNSAHYGERWGRHWLDAARYADSNGYSIDAPRNIWKYRDWVINAFNSDMPFDRFTIEQLAGDLLPNSTLDQKVATGFHRNTMINQEGGINVEQFRIESIVDRLNTTGSVFLGLTIGCAQCHDHKFDPISQREYYQLFAFFNNCDESNLEIASATELDRRKKYQAEVSKSEAELKSLDPTNPDRIEKWERSITDETRPKLSKPIAAIFEVAPNGRNAKQKQNLEDAFRRNDQSRHVLGSLLNPFSAVVHTQILNTRIELIRKREELKKKEPSLVTTMVLSERKNPRMTNVMLGGDFLRPGVPVQAGTPAVLPTLKSGPKKTRLDLAQWLVSAENPLTARVIVNRFWGIYFGTGIVETENDFGTQGTLPSHPELLDYLASEFIAKKWSMKELHRLIVNSATYRQSSKNRPELNSVDARNRWLARQNRLRLEAEVVRDVSLVSSGLINPKIGGPGIFPPQPEGVYRFTQIDKAWKASNGPDRYRRGMYTYFWRSAPHPALVVFDAPDPVNTCTRRNRSNTPLQALTLLNDTGFYEYSHALANRILKEVEGNDTAKVQHLFKVCLGREPASRELNRVLEFLRMEIASFRENLAEAKNLIGESVASGRDPAIQAAWILTARAILNLDEFITRE